MEDNSNQYCIDGKLVDTSDVIAGYHFLKNYIEDLNNKLEPCKYCGEKPEITYKDLHNIKRQHCYCFGGRGSGFWFDVRHQCDECLYEDRTNNGIFIPHHWNDFQRNMDDVPWYEGLPFKEEDDI